jgi:hypothetical protein
MTERCTFIEKNSKCKREAVSKFKGKAVCNRHLFELRTREIYQLEAEGKTQDTGEV